ncbi:MAG: metallophosphoesterase family protein [bacterium]
MNRHVLQRICLILVVGTSCIFENVVYAQTTAIYGLPVKDPAFDNHPENTFYGVRNMLSIEQLHSCIKGGCQEGLLFDIGGVTTLLDGEEIDPASVYGHIYVGPFPFESQEVDYTYHRFRSHSVIENGKGILKIDYLLQSSHNSEDWIGDGKVVARFEIYLETAGKDQELGIYDVYVSFEKEGDVYVKIPTVIEGPFVNMITSDDPTSIIVSFRTDSAVIARVVVDDNKVFSDDRPLRRHEIKVVDLIPDTEYDYYVKVGETKTKIYSFKTAPIKGKGNICFAYIGDSREGIGTGECNFMGVNRKVLERIINLGYLQKADFFLVGGDLVNGYTAVKEDFVAQLYAWKQSVAGFFHERPMYTGMGNHEALLRVFDDGSRYGISLDRWPYGTESAEAVFAQEFVNPENGPEPDDIRRPSYKENVYSFQYGPVKIIAFNNNYWVSYNSDRYGGCPEGYILEDQLNWIKGELEEAERDEAVKYVILFAQEPVFPNGGHIDDAMWYEGDNTVRAYSYDSGTKELRPEKWGIIEVRDELVRAISRCSKVAAVLGADEHSYSRVLISKNVPIGNIRKDDKNKNGKIGDETEVPSSLADLRYATWYFSAGDAGAPYYSEEKTAWNSYWKERKDTEKYYYYSSQEHVLIFNVDAQKISVAVYNPYGEIIDSIDDLLRAK